MDVIEVATGQVKAAKAPVKLRCSALGSCVAIIICDTRNKIGGIAHTMLPTTDVCIEGDNLLKYAEFAIEDLIKRLLNVEATRDWFKAKLVGGALMVAGSSDIGAQNIKTAEERLNKEGIGITGRCVGGEVSRSVTLELETGITLYKEGENEEKIL